MFQLSCTRDKQTNTPAPPCAPKQDSPVSETAASRAADPSSSGTSESPSAPQCRACTALCVWARGPGHRVSCRSRGGSPWTRARRRAKGAPCSYGRGSSLRAIWAPWQVWCVRGGRVEGEGVVWAEGGGGAAARSMRVSRRVVNSCCTAEYAQWGQSQYRCDQQYQWVRAYKSGRRAIEGGLFCYCARIEGAGMSRRELALGPANGGGRCGDLI